MVHESHCFSLLFLILLLLIIIITTAAYRKCHSKSMPEHTDPKDLTCPSSPLEVAIAEKKGTETEMLGLYLENEKRTINVCFSQ